MTRETIREALRTFGLTQTTLARAAALSEATMSRQLSGDLRLTERVQRAAEELLTRRAAQVATQLLAWVERRRATSQSAREA